MITKTTYKILFSCLLLLPGLISCKKSFLEITPKGRVIAKTTDDYAFILNNFVELGNQFFSYHHYMGDEIAAFSNFFTNAPIQKQRAFRWEDTIYEPGDDAQEITYPMKGLYYYNIVINEVMNSTGGTEAQKKSLQAEAMAARAWTYLHLINIFAKPYDPSTAATDPGFPIIKEADVNRSNFTRSSVQEVYDFIISDLTTAMPHLNPALFNRSRMSRPAAAAILGKTYLYMGKFSDALVQLNASMADFSSSTLQLGLFDINTGNNNGSFYGNIENLFSRQTSFGEITNSNAFLLSPATAQLYGSSDKRRAIMSANPGTPLPLGMLQRRSPFTTIIGMTVPDVYLMRAEVKARLNDLAGAEADVEAVRVARMPNADAQVPSSITSDRIALIKYILNERIREFAGLGYRWFDMRRLSIDPEFKSTIKTTHNWYAADGTVNATYTLRPERLTFRIPPKMLSQNSKMVDNL